VSPKSISPIYTKINHFHPIITKTAKSGVTVLGTAVMLEGL
jgi:hypothetical protein